jgi:hypothetical protein
MEKNFNQYIDDLLSDIQLPSDEELAEETRIEKVRIHLKTSNQSSKAGKACKEQKKGIHGYNAEQRKALASKAGKIRGKIVGKAHVESGHWAKCHELAKEACYIPVLQCDKKTGIVIKEWKGSKVAAQQLGISHTAISNNLKGLSKSSGGFIWKYKQ